MVKPKIKFRTLTLILIIHTLCIVSFALDEKNSELQYLLQKDYPHLTDELACQLCALAIQQDSPKANKFCLQKQNQQIRNCGLTSFAFLLTQQKLLQAFKTQYEQFYKNPSTHQTTISTILKKQHIRSNLIGWLQENADANDPMKLLEKSIANLYLQDVQQSKIQLDLYLRQKITDNQNQMIKLQWRIYQKLGLFNDALNFITKKLIELESKNIRQIDPYLYHIKGNLLMHHLKFQAGIKQFEKANRLFIEKYQQVELQRGFKFSNYNIGLCLQKLDKIQQSIRVFSRIAETSPEEDAQVLNALGNAYLTWSEDNQQNIDESKLKKGIFYLQQAIRVDHSYYIAHYNLGFSYLKFNDVQKAVRKFKDSLQIKKTDQANYGLLSAYFIQKDYSSVLSFISQNLTISSQSVAELFSLYYKFGNPKESQNIYTQIQKLAQGINSASSYYWKAMIEFEKQQYHKSIQYFQKAYDMGYTENHLLFNLAYAYQLVGQYSQAIGYYNKVFKNDPRTQTKERITQCTKLLKNQQKTKNTEL